MFFQLRLVIPAKFAAAQHLIGRFSSLFLLRIAIAGGNQEPVYTVALEFDGIGTRLGCRIDKLLRLTHTAVVIETDLGYNENLFCGANYFLAN